MRNKQKLLTSRYRTDIISRWKCGQIDEIQEKCLEYKEHAEVTEEEYSKFLQTVGDIMYQIEKEKYEEMLKYKKTTVYVLYKFTRKYVSFPPPFEKIAGKLKLLFYTLKRSWDEQVYEREVVLYRERLLEGYTLDMLYEEVEDAEDDEVSRHVKRRLYALIEEWVREEKGPLNGLKKLAEDRQNIHTFVVSKQTNKSLEILKKVAVPPGQKTMGEILSAWTLSPCLGASQEVAQVERDMRFWAMKADVVEKDDYLYRNILRSLWAKIKKYSEEVQKELIRRLWEECNESVGMCAQGHISRLTNVLVGFDEDFKGSALTADFQEKIAEISRLKKYEEKIQQATKIMDEIGMPSEERQAWLEAF